MNVITEFTGASVGTFKQFYTWCIERRQGTLVAPLVDLRKSASACIHLCRALKAPTSFGMSCAFLFPVAPLRARTSTCL